MVAPFSSESVLPPEASAGSESASGQRSLRLRLDLSYDGSAFSGWAKQPGLRTVEGTLEDAFGLIFRAPEDAGPPRLTVAGRTDVGVHATGQVVHVDLTERHLARFSRQRRGPHPGDRRPPSLPELIRRRVAGILGAYSDVVLHSAVVAPDGFDARFSALWRRYEYRIADAASHRDPLRRAETVWTTAALDVDVMHEVADSLVGLHDFAAFCRPRVGATTIRTLLDFDWARDDDGVLVGVVTADAFCHSMVRALVGACTAAGEGKLAPERVVRLRDAAVRSNAFKVMPARGLTLREVGYPDDAELAERAALTRATRATTLRDAEDRAAEPAPCGCD